MILMNYSKLKFEFKILSWKLQKLYNKLRVALNHFKRKYRDFVNK